MTTNGAPQPPARVRLTPGSWVGLASIAASVVIAMFAAVERGNARFDGMNARFDGMNARFDGMNVRMDGAHQELRAQIRAVDNRVYALVYDVSYLRGYLQDAQGDRGAMRRNLDGMQRDLRVMRADVRALRTELDGTSADPDIVRGRLRGIGGDLDLMRGNIDRMREQLDVPPVRRGWERLD